MIVLPGERPFRPADGPACADQPRRQTAPTAMESAMTMETDPWLEKKSDGLEHQYSVRADQLSQSVDDIGLLATAEPTEPPESPQSPTSPFKVTMYQCAQCKTTFSTLDMCVSHQCGLAADSVVDSTQPQSPEQPAQGAPRQPEAQQASGRSLAQQLDDSQGSSECGDNSQGSNYRWGQHDTLALMEILTSSADKFSNPNIKRKFIWKEACDKMLEKGFSISQLQCENRWKTLKAMWRKSQASSSSPAFFREMCEIAEQYPQLMVDTSLGGGDTGRVDRATVPAGHVKTNWTREASLTMLALLKARAADFSDPSIKRRALWTDISDAMRDIHMEYTPEQCEGRMKTLLQAYNCDPPWLGHRGGITFRVDLPVATRRSDPPAVRREAALRATAELPHPDVTIWSDGSARGGRNRAAQALIQFHHLNREETVRAPAGAVCSSLRAELTAMREAFAAVAGLEDGELASTKRAQTRWDLTGEGAESDCYYQVDELVQLIPELAGSAAGRAAAAVDASLAPGTARKVTAGGPRRRRAGRAARQRDLVTWLENWLQEQRRWDEGVQAVLRSQHAERLRVLTEIRDELRAGGARVPTTRPPPPLPALPQIKHGVSPSQTDSVVAQVFLT
ncbi:hypothetical protein FJT64_024450 [Amphibalanus amphitrite]|uniref:Myb/SANT-like DNA-binding domain-containing protein n=1 Tax=Amphibalanus amphitrite TaxID=1232801 RepID=A0A6A4WC40_AMPAM|nr:hypothetical protein FJT64_024450 [Amphibalanus amphitrite]